jgi:hypothetical protein
MFWRVLAVGAACVLILHGAGCENMDKVSGYFMVDPEPSAQNRLVNAPLDQVSAKVQSSMSSLGLAANTSKQGEEVRISAKESNGVKLTVVLTAIKGKDGDQTRARIEWDGGRDEQTAMLILQQLNVFSK